MIRFIRALFAWRQVRACGTWLYFENLVTGRRAAHNALGGHSPLNWEWLDAGRGHPLVNGMPAWRSAQGQLSGRYR